MVALSLWKVNIVYIFLLQWMEAMSLWKVVRFGDFVTLMDGNIVIIEGSLLLGFWYSNRWKPCHYGS